MKLLDGAINAATTPEECAREVLEVVPLIMRTIRAELRQHRSAELSIAQFRALAYLARQSGASLSELADHIGLTLPSMSKMVDGLVARGLATRDEDEEDRRRVVLCLTGAGHDAVQAALAGTEAQLGTYLTTLSDEQRATVVQAMQALRPLFRQTN